MFGIVRKADTQMIAKYLFINLIEITDNDFNDKNKARTFTFVTLHYENGVHFVKIFSSNYSIFGIFNY